MLDDFTPLAQWLRPQPVIEEQPMTTLVEDEEEPVVLDDVDDACAQARRFRASLADAVDCAVDDVLATIASAVLGRELLLAPADVRRIVTNAIDGEVREVLRVRVHPNDRSACHGLPYDVRIDDTLRPGDAVIEVTHGTIDARLGTRLSRVLTR